MNRSQIMAGLLLLGLGVVCGCLPQETNTRAQVADDITDFDQVQTVGDYTEIGNMESIMVQGVGLVHHLDGTGSSPASDGYRSQLEQAIRKSKGNPHKLLDDPNLTTSLVLVSASIPPGVKPGDEIDVSISLPPNSKTTSLKGGQLWPTELANKELAASARQAMQAAGLPVGKVPAASQSTLLSGHNVAIAQGPLLAGYAGSVDPKDESNGPRVGVIWKGAKARVNRPYYFLLSESNPQPMLAMKIAERLNAIFHPVGAIDGKLADAKVQGKPLVVANVPPTYRLNHHRFLLVARQVPLNDLPPDSSYRRKLEEELLRPESAIVSALKLEALGPSSKQALRVGLESDSPWVRFAAAESLAYLGHADGAQHLAELARDHVSLRSHCLKALASLDDAVSVDQLVELMKLPDNELRFGAYIALRVASDRHPAVSGELLNQSFWLRNVAPTSEHAAVHVVANGNSEIILYGPACPISGPCSFPIRDEFTVSVDENQVDATISKIAYQDGSPTPVSVKCQADAASMLRALGKLGGNYSDAVSLLSYADKVGCMTVPMLIDPMPKALTVNQLVTVARSDPSLDRADLEVARIGKAEDDIEPTTTLVNDGEAVQAPPPPPIIKPAPLNQNPGSLIGAIRGE